MHKVTVPIHSFLPPKGAYSMRIGVKCRLYNPEIAKGDLSVIKGDLSVAKSLRSTVT